MGLFGKPKKSKTIDLTGHYIRQQQRLSSIKSDMAKSRIPVNETSSQNSQTENSFGFLGSLASSSDSQGYNSNSNSNSNSSDEGYKTLVPRQESMASNFYDTRQNSNQSSNSMNIEEKRKKLTKRILDMTEKIEELTNQIYHLTQRVEALERRNYTGSSSYN